MGQAKYSTPVSMPTRTPEEAEAARRVFFDLGYEAEGIMQHGEECYITSFYCGRPGGVGSVNQIAAKQAGRVMIPYNLQILSALAAMREGDMFHKGEMVAAKFPNGDKMTGYYDGWYLSSTMKVKSDMSASHYNVFRPENIRKLTKEEIVAHFTSAPNEAPEPIQPEDMKPGEWYHASWIMGTYNAILQYDSLLGGELYYRLALRTDKALRPRLQRSYFDISDSARMGFTFRHATPEEIAQARAAFGETEGEQELTELPEKWCIKRTRENKDMVNWWADTKFQNSIAYTGCVGYIHSDQVSGRKSHGLSHEDGHQTAGYTEITTDQFRRLVLKESAQPAPTPSKPTLPDAVRKFAQSELKALGELNEESQKKISELESKIRITTATIKIHQKDMDLQAGSIAERNAQIAELETYLSQYNTEA